MITAHYITRHFAISFSKPLLSSRYLAPWSNASQRFVHTNGKGDTEPAEAETYPMLMGKVALITGGSKGMGRATASTFLRAGAKVVIADIRSEDGEKTAAELAEYGDILFVKTDISKSEEVQNLVSQTVAKFGRLDVAVNNAAMVPDAAELTEFDETYWRRLIDVNLTGTALCCKYEMQQMIKQDSKASIVNIASIGSFKPQPNMPAYSSSKHALIGLTKHAAMDGGKHGIRVNAIAPGFIWSDMSAAALLTMGFTKEAYAARMSFMNRFGIDHEVAQGSLWLSSNNASYVTGVCLPIDGGYMAM